MPHRAGLLLISGSLLAAAGFAQIVLPGQQIPGQSTGQYPGQSRYPGGSSSPYPGRGRTTPGAAPQDDSARSTTLSGMLRRVDAGPSIVVESDDKRIVTFSLVKSTKYFRVSGSSGKLSDLQPGDTLTVDASQDDNGYYHATRVTQIKRGTPEEQAAASKPVDTSPVTPANTASADDDDDRPRLHRPPSSSTNADSSVTADSNKTANTPAAPDPNDAGPPVLRHGAAHRESEPDALPEVAESRPPASSSSLPRPSIHAEEVNGVTRPPAAPKVVAGAGAPSSRRTGDPVIDKAIDQAFSFSQTLPDYVVKQVTTRYETGAARGGQTAWSAVDTVTTDVVSENGKETYKNVLVDGKAPKESIEKSGTWSTGEFSSLLLDILQPQTDADFHNKRTTTIVNRSAFRYDFSVARENSHWGLHSDRQSYTPEYTGAIWIDREDFRVLRIETSARNIPKGFPLDTVESAVDYDDVMISGNKYLLPVHAEALSCDRGTNGCSRNVIEFRNYRKFGADTSITFDTPQ